MDENKTIKYLAYIGVFVFILAVCWYLLTEPDVHDQRDRADDVRDELSNAGDAQRYAESHIVNAGKRIDRSFESADEIAGRIDEATERIESVQERSESVAGILEDSQRRISESRAILQAVRARKGQDGK